MRYSVVLPEVKATLKDRFVAAYYAFRTDVKPDLKATLDKIAEMKQMQEDEAAALAEKRRTALERLPGFEQSQIDSIASSTDNWRQLLDGVMPVIDQLTEVDQLVIVRHIVTGNPSASGHLAVRNWMQRHARFIFSNLKE